MTEANILLVEDNPDDEMLTLDALRHGGIAANVSIARDGADALDYLFGSSNRANLTAPPHPKLILLDLKLPKVLGLDVLRLIRSDERTKRIPVVVLTSSAEESDLVKAYDRGANSYLQKPVEFGRFVEIVKALGMYWLLLNRVPRNEA